MNVTRVYLLLEEEDQRTFIELLIQALHNRFDELEQEIIESKEHADLFDFEEDREAFRKAHGMLAQALNERHWFLKILAALLSPNSKGVFDWGEIEEAVKEWRVSTPLNSSEKNDSADPPASGPPKLIDFALHRAARGRQRRRGPPPERRNAVVAAMRAAIDAGRFSLDQLWEMPQEALAAEFGAGSRTTAVKALVNLSDEMGIELEQEPEQILDKPEQNRDKEQLGTSET